MFVCRFVPLLFVPSLSWQTIGVRHENVPSRRWSPSSQGSPCRSQARCLACLSAAGTKRYRGKSSAGASSTRAILWGPKHSVRTGVLSAGGALVLRRSDLARVALRNKARQDQTRQDKIR